jgi:DNA-binding phage protein
MNAKLNGDNFSLHTSQFTQTRTASMTTSRTRTASFLSEIADLDAKIPAGKRAYLGGRARQEFYDYILRKFMKATAERGLTKAKLARRIGIGSDRMSKILGAPGNWTIETIADLLAGISAEEVIPHSISLINRAQRNYAGRGRTWSVETDKKKPKQTEGVQTKVLQPAE